MKNQIVCTVCGFVGKPKKSTKGSIWIELVLWLCLIVPGIIYSLWRIFSGKQVLCPKCGSTLVIPADTPKGQELIARQGVNAVK